MHCPGITGPSAEDMTEQQRRDVARQLALLRVVVMEEDDGQHSSDHM